MTTVQELLKQRGLPSNFCAVPFTSLILEPTGEVACCREHGLKQVVGDLKTQSIEEIWNGPRLQAWRREFLSGKPCICDVEIRHRGCNQYVASPRLIESIEINEVQTSSPVHLGLNLNGRCNLHCPMCGVWKMPNGVYDDPDIWKKVEAILPLVQEIEMLGGEPFIQDYTFKVMDIIAEVNPGCRWLITTNAHWDLTEAIRARLDRLEFREIIVSTDSLDTDVYSKVRAGGRLEKFMSTVADLISYDQDRRRSGKGGLNLTINSTIQILNWREIPSLIDFADKNGFLKANIAFLYSPKKLSLLSLSERERESILEHLTENLSGDHLTRSREVLRPLLESVSPLFRANIVAAIAQKTRARR
jgi:cyclic pyranopterin phosphate synthase